MNLEDILQDKDFGHHMRLQKGEIEAFYQPGQNHDSVIAERCKWLEQEPETYSALLPEGTELLTEAIQLAKSIDASFDIDSSQGDPIDHCRMLGKHWESDFILMKPDAKGVFRLVGGCLCFPSHWAIQDKLKLTMSDIHGPVPGLNDAVGKQIDTFLQRIKPGISWQRVNWGLARTSELNLHPSRIIPRLDSTIELKSVWWRLEEQSLVSLPNTGGILFGIKVTTEPLSVIKNNPAARQGMIRTLQTMPESMAAYKGIDASRDRIIELLESDQSP